MTIHKHIRTNKIGLWIAVERNKTIIRPRYILFSISINELDARVGTIWAYIFSQTAHSVSPLQHNIKETVCFCVLGSREIHPNTHWAWSYYIHFESSNFMEHFYLIVSLSFHYTFRFNWTFIATSMTYSQSKFFVLIHHKIVPFHHFLFRIWFEMCGQCTRKSAHFSLRKSIISIFTVSSITMCSASMNNGGLFGCGWKPVFRQPAT